MSATKDYLVKPGSKVKLSDWDPADDGGLARAEAEQRMAENLETMAELQHKLYAEGKRALLVVLQGMDAAGKDSTVRHVFGRMNPTGVRVTSFKRPTEEELAHDFLWRVHRQTPPRGGVAIFNRSHYEDVLVVRVDELVSEKVWKRRYGQIRSFETYLNQGGTEIVKIYFHISKGEQRRKLVRRITDPKRNWKFEPADFVTRGKWDQYMAAYEEALGETSTEESPWYVVPSDVKWYRKWLVSEIVVKTLERIRPDYPPVRLDPGEAMRLIESIE